jgi:hypothetical protein
VCFKTESCQLQRSCEAVVYQAKVMPAQAGPPISVIGSI